MTRDQRVELAAINLAYWKEQFAKEPTPAFASAVEIAARRLRELMR